MIWAIYLLSFLVPTMDGKHFGWHLFCGGFVGLSALCPAWLANPAFWLASYFLWKREAKKAKRMAAISTVLGLGFWAWLWIVVQPYGDGDWYKLARLFLPYWVWLASPLLLAIVSSNAELRSPGPKSQEPANPSTPAQQADVLRDG